MKTAGQTPIPDNLPPERIKLFESRIERNEYTECWLWIGKIHPSGYGLFPVWNYKTHKKHRARAHRVSWVIYRGPIPLGKVICHKCDVKLCVNPKHLYPGTQLDNMRDMKCKGRGTKGKKLRKRK